MAESSFLHQMGNPTGHLAVRGFHCRASDSCPYNPLPREISRIALCGKHLREAYEDAQDLISERWDDACRRYVADLQNTFKPPPAITRRPRQGYVYFIRFGHRVKVGFTENPNRRLGELPHEEVIGVVSGTREDEMAWHALLTDFRVTGEWYQAEPEVMAQIRSVVAKAG